MGIGIAPWVTDWADSLAWLDGAVDQHRHFPTARPGSPDSAAQPTVATSQRGKGVRDVPLPPHATASDSAEAGRAPCA